MRFADWIKIILVAFAFVAPARAGAEGATAAAAMDCNCPKLTCNFECEYEQLVSFYSEKCEGGKVRSCSRPTCLALPSAPPSCTAAKTDVSGAERGVASIKQKVESDTPESLVVGEVAQVEGQAWIVKSSVEKTMLSKGNVLRESDKVATGDKSKIEISFKDGNAITLTANSILELSKITFNEDIQKRNTLLNLMKGRVRSKVNNKYLGSEQSHFRVKTRAAVAGVRGTDFIVTFEQVNEDLLTKIDTLKGEVELASPLKKHHAIVAKTQTVTYVAKGMANVGAVSDEIEADFASRGHMTEVMSLKDAQLEVLDRETTVNYAMNRRPSSVSGGGATAANEKICAQPEGQFNQCSWTCENNPKGEKRCRTELPSVNCVRRVCNANGVWSGAARLPAAFADSCDPAKVVVDTCDY